MTELEVEIKLLVEEPGIPELEKLYYDKYDDDNGGFKGMTQKDANSSL